MEAIIAKRLAKVAYMTSPQASVDDPPPVAVETVIATDSAVLDKRRHFYLIGKPVTLDLTLDLTLAHPSAP